MKKVNFKVIAYWFMIFLVVYLSVYTLRWIKTESYQCINNPLVYSIKLLEQSNDAQVTAIISVHKENSKPILLTRDGFTNLDT